MKTKKTTWLGATLLAIGWLAAPAQAGVGTSSYLNIDVAIVASMSVSVNSVNSTTQTVTWTGTPNQQLFSPSSAAVTNDSGVFTERWKLFTNANSINTVGGSGTWALAASSTSVGADEFVVQAVFGSSNTSTLGCGAATSTGTYVSGLRAPILPTSIGAGAQYTTAGQLASTELQHLGGSHLPDVATNAGSMLNASQRALCWRIITPNSTSTTETQNIQVVVAAY